jgi:hypothetical protein
MCPLRAAQLLRVLIGWCEGGMNGAESRLECFSPGTWCACGGGDTRRAGVRRHTAKSRFRKDYEVSMRTFRSTDSLIC